MAEVSGSAAKVCSACAKDVSNLPRTKDAQGRYFCKACVEKLKNKNAQAAKPPEQDAVMAKLLADSPGVELCPNCGGGIQVGAKICIRCGFNKETGKAMRVQVEAAKKEKGETSGKSGVSFMDAMNKMADSPLGLLFSAGGAFLGGCAGAGVYSWVMVSSGYEVYLIAVVIGLLTGVGAWIPVRGFSGTMHGVIAAVIALAATIGGRYIAIDQFADDFVSQVAKSVKVEEDDVVALVGRDVAKEWSSQGKNYQWPEDADPVNASSEEEFPVPIWEEAKSRYATLDESAKKAKWEQANAELKQQLQDFKSEATSEAFSGTLNERSGGFRKRSGWVGYIKWTLVGIVVAFAVGSGGRNPFQD